MSSDDQNVTHQTAAVNEHITTEPDANITLLKKRCAICFYCICFSIIKPCSCWKSVTLEAVVEHGDTVKPLLSGPLLLNGHLSNSQKVFPLFTVHLTSIKRSPLLSGCSHHLEFPIG